MVFGNPAKSVYHPGTRHRGAGGMDARLEAKLRLLAALLVFGAIAGFAFSFAQGRLAPRSVVTGISYGLLISTSLGIVQLFVLEGPMRAWLSGLPFAASLMLRSAIYAAVIIIIQGLELGERIAGLPLETTSRFSGPASSIPPSSRS